MSFDLRLRFIGLALYVPEGKKAMHVLLPATTGHQHEGHHGNGGNDDGSLPAGRGGVTGNEQTEPSRGEGDTATFEASGDADEPGEATVKPGEALTTANPIDSHFVRIVYDAAYERAEEGRQLSRTYKVVDFTGRLLKLRRGEEPGQVQTAEELDSTLTDELPPLEGVAQPVDRKMVEELPRGAVAGRVTVDTGALTHYALGATFHLNDDVEARRMTPETEWTIRGITSQIPTGAAPQPLVPGLPETLLQGASDTPQKKLPRLYPIGQTIELLVFNAVSTEFPPGGSFHIENKDGDAEHFEAYYAICPKLDTRADTTPRQTPEVPDVDVDGDELPKRGGPQRPGFTCVHAQAMLA